ncbi:MAG: UDP-N-acetylmuramoyl-tripeptide--D-alanyl-D-alanine ligase [Microscillaceae bacterium]
MPDAPEFLYSIFLNATGISTDSRQIFPGSIFFALKGARFNGNAYAAEALEKGAAFLVVDEEMPASMPSEKYLRVESALAALQALAHYHRRQWKGPLIAIGGSNGKTTTKELVQAVLASHFRSFATPGNLNNHIGVPLSLLQIKPETEIAVIEMGANHARETWDLCQIAEPDYGLVTNVGKDHLEGFGSVEGVAKANGELYDYLRQRGGTIFLNTLEPWLSELAGDYPKVVRYPQLGNDYVASFGEGDFFIKIKTQKGHLIDTQLFGAYNFANAASALCIGHYFKVPEAKAHAAVAAYAPANNRSQVLQIRSNIVLMDAYNANPSSMAQALASFSRLRAKNKLVILGDMFELGAASQAEHAALGNLIARENFETVVLFGTAMQAALPFVPKAYYFTDKFSLHNWLQDRQLENYHILIKGSRGIALETALNFI